MSVSPSTVLSTAAYPTVIEQAAALLPALARNHPLIDRNEAHVVLDDKAAFGLVMDVAEGRAEVGEIAKRLTIE